MKGKAKVKSGCRTCKARKVKCDEGRPSCQRCVSTGRYCDGYGIWGGGTAAASNSLLAAGPKDHKLDVSRPLASMLPSRLSPNEKRHFELFRVRTSVKLPGTFVSGFWKTLLLQTGSSDPAVLHAIIAVSAIQNRHVIESSNDTISSPDAEEQFALRHYLKAIACIRPNLSSRDRALSRTALVACTVFVVLELLRGYFDAAQTHFQNGLGVMQHLGMLVKEDDNVLRFKSSPDPVDDWIVEVFSRLHLQIELMRYGTPGSSLVLRLDAYGPVTRACQNIYVAWRDLGQFFNDVLYLKNQIIKCGIDGYCAVEKMTPKEYQGQTRKALGLWYKRLEALRTAPAVSTSADVRRAKRICYNILSVYHSMALIMLETCTSQDGEMVYDSYTELFNTMLREVVDLWDFTFIDQRHRSKPGYGHQIQHSIADLGAVAPLFYIATKCRVHCIRLRAIGMMESKPYREGIWDSQVSGCVARKVMEMEESGFYPSAKTEGVDHLEPITLEDASSLPTLAASHRMEHVEIVVSGSPMDNIILTCTKGRSGLDQLHLISTYDIRSQAWNDFDALDPLTPGEWHLDDLTSSDFSSGGFSPIDLSLVI